MTSEARWQKVVGEGCFQRLLASAERASLLEGDVSNDPTVHQLQVAAAWEQIELYMELAYRVTLYARERIMSGMLTQREIVALRGDRQSALRAMLAWIVYYRDELGNPCDYIGDEDNPQNYVFTTTGQQALTLALRVNMADVGPGLDMLLRESLTPTQELQA